MEVVIRTRQMGRPASRPHRADRVDDAVLEEITFVSCAAEFVIIEGVGFVDIERSGIAAPSS